jgi:hypothetical protein
MANTGTIPDTTDEDLVRIGRCFVTPAAAQLHIFGVLLGAHLGAVGFVPDADLGTLPPGVRDGVGELIACGIWRRTEGGYRIDPDAAIATMRESLDRLNDPARCVATGSAHVRGDAGGCVHCGATAV